jgi:hypothetical protein
MPRKTLFKPVKRPNMLNNPLWCEVFLESDKKNGEDESDDEGGVLDDQDNGFSSNDELLM